MGLMYDFPDARAIDLIQSAQSGLRIPVFFVQLSNFSYLDITKFYMPISLSSIASSFAFFIQYVLQVRAQYQMTWTHTTWIIAGMHND